MQLSMVSPAERDGKFVTDLAPEGGALRKAQMMGIRGETFADEAWLLGDVSRVLSVSPPAGLRKGQDTFVDADLMGSIGGSL